jgi:hypothetical protein
MFALVPGLGEDRFQSIEAMRKKSSILREMPYDSLVSGKRAIGIWYAGDAQVILDKISVQAGVDSLILQATFPNPGGHNFSAQAIISSIDNSYTDSLLLYDDGNHHDQEANDGIWGTIVSSMNEENVFGVSLIANDLNTKALFGSNELAHFTTIGPIVYENYIGERGGFLGSQYEISLFLHNDGNLSAAKNVSAKLVLISVDTCYSEMDQSTTEFDDIAPGQTVESNDKYVVQLEYDCNNKNIPLTFRIDISLYGYIFWRDTLVIDILTDLNEPDENLPRNFTIQQNYPNPFNPKTVISYQLPVISDVELSIYNLLGEKVTTPVSTTQNAGYHQVEWDASGFASGVYYYQIRVGEFQEIKKMLLLR